MAVIVQYIVIRDGVQKMTFATKKEADAYDKMLDIADNLYEFIETAELDIEDKLLEDLTFFLAKNKDEAMALLRGVKPKPADPEKDEEAKKELKETSSKTENKTVKQLKPTKKAPTKEKK